ncbi:MAG: transposase [Chloroflexota bacterium]|nr:transposase [Chloroflexota bacterium]
MTEAEWEVLEFYLPAPKPGNRPRIHRVREILDAIFSVVPGGCAWRLLAHDFPLWKTV